MFHMADCEASQGEFRDYKPPERMLVAQHFRRQIAECGLPHTSSSADVAAWDELIVGPVREFLGPASEVCFVNCLDRAREITPPADRIAVVFDQGLESGRLHSIVDLYKKHAGVVSITFGKVKDIYPLQAADIVATQHYWMAQEWMKIRPTKDPDVAFRHAFKDKLGEGLLFDREGYIKRA
jgi:hypothetical protein